MADPRVAGRWTALSPSDREHFEAAIARHRRASWRVTAACAAAVAALTLVVSVLMAPLLYAAISIAADLVNIATPAPDVMGWIGRRLDPVLSGRAVSADSLVRLVIVAALPGLGLMAAITWGLRRIWRRSPLFNGGEVPGRPPDRTVLAELRLADVVEEMAIAAGIPPPRVVIVPGGVNAAACGRDAAHVTLLVGEALPSRVGRDELEGMVAHLIGSIADGDMTIGLRVTTTMALFGLMARLAGSMADREAFWETVKLWRVFAAPTSANTIALLGALGDPFQEPVKRRPREPAAGGGSLTWREWAAMPFMGPAVLTGFLSGIVTEFFLEPLVALAWRQRKYMADAVAVQLTRDPDGLASALAAIEEQPQGIAPWTAHLAVAGPGGVGGPFGVSIVPIFPGPEKRVDALIKMGAHAPVRQKRRMPWPLVAILSTLAAIGAILLGVVVYLLVILSAMLSMLFTVMPAAAVHVLLRWLAR